MARAIEGPATKSPGLLARWGWDKLTILLLLPALAFMLALFIYPLIYGIVTSLNPKETGTFSFDNYLNIFKDEREVTTIWNTFWIALPVTLICVILAVPLSYWMRQGIRFERVITTLLILPITLGTVLVSQGMLSYFGRKGWFNQALQAVGLVNKENPLALVYNYFGVELGLFIQGFPLVFLMVLGYMSGINPDLEKSARMLGANKWQSFWRVIFPLSVPGIAIAFCLSFVANFSVFPTAVLVGQPTGATRVMAFAAYQAAFEKYDYSLGSTIAIIMAVIELAVIGVVLVLRSRTYRGSSTGGKG